MITTTVVGSYPQPDWLIHRDRLGSKVPRVRAPDIWRVDSPFLEEAQDDATLLAIRDMELAGIDIITDGEMRRESYSNRFATALDGVDIVSDGEIRRESYSNRFATALEGVDLDNPGTALDRSGHPNPVRIRG